VPGRAIDSRSAHQLDEPSRLGGYHDAGSGCFPRQFPELRHGFLRPAGGQLGLHRGAACPSSGGPAGPRPEPMPRLVLPAALPRVVDGKPRVTSFFRADTVRRVGRGRTRQGTDPHPPETSAFQGRGSHQESTSLPSLVRAPYYACPRRLGSPPRGRPWSAAP